MLAKKAVLIFTTIIFILQLTAGYAKAAPEEVDSGFDESFLAYVLCDSESGQVVAQKNSDSVFSNVGLSQLMSIYIFLSCIDNGELSLEDQVKISEFAAGQGGSQIFLEPQDNYTVETLLKGVIVVSANDACVALAERIAGSEEDFVKLMNAKAQDIGLKNTHFINCTGYMADGEETSAKDIVTLSSRLIKYPLFFNYSTIWQDTIVHSDEHKTDIVNANRIVKINSKCDGIGVGSSKDTGYSISVTGKSGESRFIFVGIGAQSAKKRTAAANAAMESAFNNYTSKTFLKAGQLIKKDFTIEGAGKKEILLYAKSDISLLLKKGEENTTEKKLEIISNLVLPLAAGNKVGEVVIYKNGEKIASSDVIVKEDVFKLTYTYCLNRVIYWWIF